MTTRNPLYHWAVVSVMCSTIVSPRRGESADEPAVPTTPIKVVDIALDKGGTLRGTVINGNGQTPDAANVVIRQGGRSVATAVTQRGGRFVMSGLQPGVYELQTGRTAAIFRLWSAGTAPPAAHSAALLVEETTIVRGQQWNPWERAFILSGVIITSGVIGGVIGYNIKDDAS